MLPFKIAILFLSLFLTFSSTKAFTKNDWIKAAKTSMVNQEVDQAIFYYSQALADDPTLTIAYLDRSTAHLMNKDFEKAAEDKRKAYKLDPAFVKRYYELKKNNNLIESMSSDL